MELEEGWTLGWKRHLYADEKDPTEGGGEWDPEHKGRDWLLTRRGSLLLGREGGGRGCAEVAC